MNWKTQFDEFSVYLVTFIFGDAFKNDLARNFRFNSEAEKLKIWCFKIALNNTIVHNRIWKKSDHIIIDDFLLTSLPTRSLKFWIISLQLLFHIRLIGLGLGPFYLVAVGLIDWSISSAFAMGEYLFETKTL